MEPTGLALVANGLIVLMDNVSRNMFFLSPVVLGVFTLLGAGVGVPFNRRWYYAPAVLVLLFFSGFFVDAGLVLYALAVLFLLVLLLVVAVRRFARRLWLGGSCALVAVVACVAYLERMNAIGNRAWDKRSSRMHCRNHLRGIARALYLYHDDFGCFPPAVTTDGHGRAMHSWTVYLLPYLDAWELHQAYNFRHAHDAPANATVTGTRLEQFVCPTAQRRRTGQPDAPVTDYGMVVCPGSIGGTDRYVRKKDITDGPSKTAIVAEMSRTACRWASPDAVVDPSRGINVPADHPPGASSAHQGGAFVLFADGVFNPVQDGTAPATLRALCTMAGNKMVDDEDW